MAKEQKKTTVLRRHSRRRIRVRHLSGSTEVSKFHLYRKKGDSLIVISRRKETGYASKSKSRKLFDKFKLVIGLLILGILIGLLLSSDKSISFRDLLLHIYQLL